MNDKTPFDLLRDILDEQESNRLRILTEHADFRTALIRIDGLLVSMRTADTADVPLLIQQMRDAMPLTIVATRKGE